MVYKAVIIDITEKQLSNAIKGKSVRFTNDQLGRGTKVLMLHPENAKKVEKSVLKRTGVSLHLADGELAATYERMMKSGGAFFSNIWKGLKKVWGVLKDTGAATQLLDMAVAPLSVATGQPALVGAVRQGVKSLTGAGAKGRMTKQSRQQLLEASGLYLSNQ